ncbi:hypothetical protein NM22_13275 [Vibrio tubiashii]|nr:hypothetical protein NM22_13275 [Vibrio tubiashii]
MNAKSLAPFMLANTTVVIDINGEIRELVPGEVPAPGEVIVTLGQGATTATEPQIEAQLIGQEANSLDLNLDNEIASIIEQIEQGVDPTQNEDFATAAGGQNGSSPTGSGDIDRTGVETLAETQFDTSGLESQGLSETQSLALIDLVAQAIFVGDDAVTVFETDEPLVVTGTVLATETDTPTFIPQDEVAGDNGIFSIDSDGNWTYVANSAFDELNVGDSLVDVFPIESTDGTLGSVTVTINGTNDLPQFVAVDDFVPQGPEGDDQLATFAFEDGAYSFSFEENTAAGTPIGQVAATDPDNEVLIFSISTNIQNEGGEDLFQIDPDTGEISLTDAGAASFANDFEQLANTHPIVVTVTEGDGIGEPQSVDVDVTFTELNVNEPPTSDEPEGGYEFTYDENSLTTVALGQVSATDLDANDSVSYSITTNVEIDGEPLYRIDAETGEIFLTDAGAAAFTNDFESTPNVHDLKVTATDTGGLTDIINVTMKESDINEPPTSDEPEGGYEFTYDENSLTTVALGQVSATDLDANDSVSYSITTNVEIDGEPLYRIDAETGEIFLTDAGAVAFTNDFESTPNVHDLKVTATDTGGLTDIINVTMKERDVNERPEATDFSVDAGTATFVPIIFDSEDPLLDRISDEDDDASGTQVLIMLSSLPDSGTLLYIEDGVTRVITESDLISVDDYDMEDPANLDKMFVPNNIVYVPGVGEEFELGTSGDPAGIELVGGFDNWGEPVSDVERVVTLENGNQITVTFVDQNPNGSPNAKLKQYEGAQPHVGYGIADNQGNGLQPGEQIIFNLQSNPLTVVHFGLDGLGGNFATGSVVLVTYELASGAFVTEEYSKDPSDVGNANIYYEFSYSSPDDPIVGMTFDSTGGSYEIRYLSGNEDVVEDVTFDYVAVDSGLLISEERTVSIDTTESPEYQVVTADESGNVEADIGNQVMLGDSDDNIFVWLDNTLDNGTDVIDNFELGSDRIDLRAILEDDDNVELNDLVDSISAVVDGDNVVMTVTDEGREQTIILEGVTSAFEDAGLIENNSIISELEMLNQVLKTDATT